MQYLTLLLLSFIVSACTTGQVQKEESHTFSDKQDTSLPQKAKAQFSELDYKIDYSGLENYLKLQDRKSNLGLQSANFNSCEVGSYGLSRNEPCYDLTMSVIRFKLQCRDSEGTTDIVQTEYNVQPIANTKINWELSDTKKSLRTDSEGYGKIQIVTEGNPSSKRLRLSNGNDFVYVRAKDIKRIVTPAPWCR